MKPHSASPRSQADAGPLNRGGKNPERDVPELPDLGMQVHSTTCQDSCRKNAMSKCAHLMSTCPLRCARTHTQFSFSGQRLVLGPRTSPRSSSLPKKPRSIKIRSVKSKNIWGSESSHASTPLPVISSRCVFTGIGAWRYCKVHVCIFLLYALYLSACDNYYRLHV